MKYKSSSEITMLRMLTTAYWESRSDEAILSLSSDDTAFALLEKIIADGTWPRPFKFLFEMHAAATAIRQANAAREAIDEMFEKERTSGY